ncbi:MAG: nucleotidyltransferase domain-containing protein [bacterium]|nr:nucleotidyltransferase domain-containing protein [bacterium]
MALASASTVVAPTLEDARQVSEVLAENGAGMVLVFGSVAWGTADECSDIDMVAVFDDLGDYSCRYSLKGRLTHSAHRVTRASVDVWVTDRAEWQRRTTMVTSSFEAAIAGNAIVLCDRPATRPIDWDKEIGMPADNYNEALKRLMDTANALGQVFNGLYETPLERRAADENNTDDWAHARYERMARMCADSQLTIECAYKTVVCLAGVKSERIHSIGDLAEVIPEEYSDVTGPATSPLNRTKPSGITLWHTAGDYSDARPALTLHEIEETAIELAQMATKTSAALANHFEGTGEGAAAYLNRVIKQTETELATSEIGKHPPLA